MTRPGRPRSEQVEQAIVAATIELLADFGLHGLSIEAVAAKAGVAKTTVYRRWGGKDDLVLDVLSRLKGPIGTPPGQSLRGDLLHLLEHIRAQWVRGPQGRLMHRLSVEGWDRPELYRSFRERLVKPRQQVMLDVLQVAVDDGRLRSDVDVQAVLDLLVSPIIAAMFTHQGLPSRKRLEFNVDTVLAGCGAGSPIDP